MSEWMVVPVEPTPIMLKAAWHCTKEVPHDERMGVLLQDAATAHQVKMLRRWRAMLAAAPEPPSSGELADQLNHLAANCELDGLDHVTALLRQAAVALASRSAQSSPRTTQEN